MTILYLYLHRFASWRKRLAGIYRFARGADWHVEPIEASGLKRKLRRTVDFWRADGFVAEGGLVREQGFSADDFRHRAVVWCDVGERELGVKALNVRHDSRETARRAIDALLALEVDCYGYVGYRVRREWSDERADVFRRKLAERRLAGRVFVPCPRGQVVSGALQFFDGLKKWLAEMPKPCGILAANDEMGAHVLQAAQRLGFSVPDEVAVLGIDNDELLCENTFPPLASIAPDFETSGYLAARLLAERFENPRLRAKTIFFGCASVVHRRSLLRVTGNDAAVVRALEHIRQNGCGSLRVTDVAAAMGVCRRSAEIRFRRATGRSLHDEIRAARILRAKELLARKDMLIGAICAQCGYRDERSLRYAFRKACGVSMNEYRKSL